MTRTERDTLKQGSLAAGNVTSIEPGFYEDGQYGIRLENVAIVREVKTKHQFGGKPFLGFEHVTMVPFCQRLIDVERLSLGEKTWLNAYHTEVFAKTSPHLEQDPMALDWLRKETREV